jgi:3-oxoacyl-[acyl-carrier-protein] synthase II
VAKRPKNILGIGAVTGYGWGREYLWQGLVSGKSAAVLTAGFGVKDDGPGWLAHVPDGGDFADGPSRFQRAIRASTREAVTDALARGWRPGPTVGLVHAAVLGEVDLWRDFYHSDGHLSVHEFLALMPSTPMSTAMQEFGFTGPVMNVSSMCASGNAALLTAEAWLDSGLVTDVIVGATDISCTIENVRHFVNMGVAIVDREPADACRPFQAGTRGFMMAEASSAMVLSTTGDRPYALMHGGSMRHDGFHVTSIRPSLGPLQDCYESALAQANVSAVDVAYFNAHGPGTRQCDAAEGTLVAQLFPQAGLYSLKPLVGHTQAAASLIEISAAAMGYDRGQIPAPHHVAAAHPQLLDGPTAIHDGLTMKSSIGLGGHNSAVIIGHRDFRPTRVAKAGKPVTMVRRVNGA